MINKTDSWASLLDSVQQAKECRDDPLWLAGVTAAKRDDRVVHRGCVFHPDHAQGPALDLPGHGRARQQGNPEASLDHLLGRLDRIQFHQSAQLGAGRQKCRLGDLVVAGGPVEHDQLLARNLHHRHERLFVKAWSGAHTRTSSSVWNRLSSRSGWRMARPSPSCTSSRSTSWTTSSEWPVRTDTSTRGCVATNFSNSCGNTYVLTAGAAAIIKWPAESDITCSSASRPSASARSARSAYGTHALPASVRRIPCGVRKNRGAPSSRSSP